MTETQINYIEHTGNYTRVGILCHESVEAYAIFHAEDVMDMPHAWVDMMTWGFEIVFEA